MNQLATKRIREQFGRERYNGDYRVAGACLQCGWTRIDEEGEYCPYGHGLMTDREALYEIL